MSNSHQSISAATEDAWLLVKRGLFYRPNNSGYTGIRDEAGRYSRQDADEHMAAGGKAMREADAPEFMPGAYSDIVIKRLIEQRDEARVELARIRGDAQGWRDREPLVQLLMRCRTVLGNMAEENEGPGVFFFNRWPINHEPLRADARNLAPIVSQALSDYHAAFMKIERETSSPLSRPMCARDEEAGK